MNIGDMVKYKEPVDVHEEDERFVVLEDRGDRVLVGSLFLDLPLGVTSVLRTDDLMIAIPYEEGKEKGLEDSDKLGPFLTISPYPAATRERNDWSRGYHEIKDRYVSGTVVGRE